MAGGHALMSSPRLLLLGGPSPGGPHRGGRDLRPPTELREAEPELEILINEQLVLQEPEFSQRAYVLEAPQVVLSGYAPALIGVRALPAAFLRGSVGTESEIPGHR